MRIKILVLQFKELKSSVTSFWRLGTTHLFLLYCLQPSLSLEDTEAHLIPVSRKDFELS